MLVDEGASMFLVQSPLPLSLAALEIRGNYEKLILTYDGNLIVAIMKVFLGNIIAATASGAYPES